MTTFTPNYSKLSVVKSSSNKDSGNESGDSLGVWLDCNQHPTNNSTQNSKVILTLSYVDGYTSGNPILKKGPSKRWFVWYRFTTNIYWNGGMITSYGINIWDNHGQRYDHTYIESTDPSYYKKIIIQEDDKKFPEPLSDILIDSMKGAPIPFYTNTSVRVEKSIFDFQNKLNHFYLPRATVTKEMKELEELRKEIKELRERAIRQEQEISAVRVDLRELQQTHQETVTELAEQKTLVKVLTGSLGRIVDKPTLEMNNKNRLVQVESVPTNPTQLTNPFDTL